MKSLDNFGAGSKESPKDTSFGDSSFGDSLDYLLGTLWGTVLWGLFGDQAGSPKISLGTLWGPFFGDFLDYLWGLMLWGLFGVLWGLVLWGLFGRLWGPLW